MRSGQPTPQQLHSRFNRLHISHRDFEECRTYLEAYGDVADKYAVQQAVLVAAVVAYSRPFLKSNTSGRSLHSIPGSVLQCLDDSERILHKRIVAIRNSAVAHSDFKMKAVHMLYGRPGAYQTISKPFDVRTELWNDVPAFRGITEKLLGRCVQEMGRVAAQLHGDTPRLHGVTGRDPEGLRPLSDS